MTLNKKESPIEILSTGKNWIKNPFIRQFINLWLISKDEYLSLKWDVEDKTIIEWLWARAIKYKIKEQFDKIMTSWVDKWDNL